MYFTALKKITPPSEKGGKNTRRVNAKIKISCELGIWN